METEVKIIDLEGAEIGSVSLPNVFNSPVREDVINRVYVALESHSRQPQGRDPLAGERTTAESGHPPTGRGIARIPRVKGERYSKSGMAGGVASTVGGRLPHPPRSEKVIHKLVNKKERFLALASAIAATANADIVTRRGHKFTAKLPIIVSGDLEKIEKVRELKKFLQVVGADVDCERVKNRRRKVSSSLSRISRTGSGPLFVVSNKVKLQRVANSMGGISVVKSSDISVLDLAPGSAAGRLTIWTKDALSALSKNVLSFGV